RKRSKGSWPGIESRIGIARSLARGGATERSYTCRPHATKTADQNGRGHLLDTQDRGRAGVWTNQTGAWLPAVSLAWTEEDKRGMGAHLPHSQHSEATSALLCIEEKDKQDRNFYE